MSPSGPEVDLEITEGPPQEISATAEAEEERYTTRLTEAIGGVSPKMVEASPSGCGGSGCSGGSGGDEPQE